MSGFRTGPGWELPGEEEGLEGGEVLRERDALLGAFHEGLELGRDLHGLADDAFHGVLELGRVGGFTEDTVLSRLEPF